MNKYIANHIEVLEKKAIEMGLDFYDMKYEVVPIEVMLEVMSYGLPTRARHWKYGQSFEYQKMSGEMGTSKVYELVLNNDPCYAFLLDSNPDIINVFVSAHVLGHCHFFKNNWMFKRSDNQMVYRAAERASRIDSYIQKYGLREVERVMDMAFAFEKNIDWHKGVERKKYKDEENVIKVKNTNVEFEDISGPRLSFNFIDKRFPPSAEKDILWFLINYSKLDNWKKDVFDIIRQESHYFYPQYLTKIMNEGFAVYIHTELMLDIDVTPTEFIEYSKLHERVVQPGGNKFSFNPYYLGFKIFKDIEKRWNKKFEDGDSEINGFQKILNVVEEENDISFVRNYLTKELCEEMELFVYQQTRGHDGSVIVQIVSKDLDDIKEYVLKDLYNYRAPNIKITGASGMGLELEHCSTEYGTLDGKHLRTTMSYLYEIWGAPIDIKTIDENKNTYHLTLDEDGFSD